jgi:hypothetical protein
MKIRKSFVSNSSTSSFILVGCKADDLHLTREEEEKIYDDEYTPIRLCNDGELLGVELASWSDDDGIEEIDFEVLSKYVDDSRKTIEEFCKNKNISAPKIKVYAGIEAC